MNIKEIATSRLREYENNPRNNDLAVEKVKFSIERFGFLFPVVVDINYVIVCGHTRVRACRELGIQTVPCIIADELTEEQINLFRLIDNKTSEYSDWDFEKLKNELSTVDLTLEKNQILLERFELTAEVFDIEPEMAEIKVPSLNFMKEDTKNKKPSVSTTHVDQPNDHENAEETNHEEVPKISDELNDTEYDATEKTREELNQDPDVNESENSVANDSNKSKAFLPLYQFRFGEVSFFISKIESDRLNAKFAEYIDSNEATSISFVEYLLGRLEND